MTDFGFLRATDEVLAIRIELADRVVQELERAGLPAFRDGSSDDIDQAGAVVYVDPDAEMATAAVSVSWRCAAGALQAARDALIAGSSPDARAVRYPGAMGTHMQGALVKVLLSAGIIATLENDTTNPDHVLVFGQVSDLPPALRPTFTPRRG